MRSLAGAALVLVSLFGGRQASGGEVGTDPAAGAVAVGPMTGDAPPGVEAALSAALVTVVRETGRAPAPGQAATWVLRLDARTEGEGLRLTLVLVEPGGPEQARIEASTTRAAADARARALARELLASPAISPSPSATPATGTDRRPPEPPAGSTRATAPPPPPRPVGPPVDFCLYRARPMAVAGSLLSAVGLAWFTYEAIALHTDLQGVPLGSAYSYGISLAGSVVANLGYRRTAACYDVKGRPVEGNGESVAWVFTGASVVAFVGGLLVAVIGGSKVFFDGFDSHDDEDDDEQSERLAEEQAAYFRVQVRAHSFLVVGAGLEVVNLLILRPLVWGGAIDRAAGRGKHRAALEPALLVANDGDGAWVPLPGIRGAF